MPTTRAAASKDRSERVQKPKSEQPSDKKRKAESKPKRPEKKRKTQTDESLLKPKGSNGVETIENSPDRASEVSSNIVEKGIIYFLTRGRVEMEEPEKIADLQRSYFVLRPLPKDAKLNDGRIPDARAARLIAVPKKTFPKSHRDRFMVFVESTKKKMSDLKEQFFDSSEKETKTMGTRKTPAVTIVGEGVYAITIANQASHLAYILAIPAQPGAVQTDLGIHDKGSFIISLKNPTIKGPQNSQLSASPDFPKNIMDDFKGYRWIPIQRPEHLDYPNAQLLLIGEGKGDFGSALKSDGTNQANSKEEDTQTELEKLEGEEELRIEHLHGDSSVFDDLHISKKDFSLESTWN